ncbi:MAG: FmdB family zinc ribbon protein [Longimicrobiales bacterium]
MPTYEYRCSNGHEFEQFQRMSEEPLRVCTVCGAPAERIMSAGTGLLFKGSGFYITDYRSDSYRKAADADSAPKPAKDAAAPKKDAASPAKDAEKKTGSSGSKSVKDE